MGTTILVILPTPPLLRGFLIVGYLRPRVML
jgi:hypothetical protein